MWDSVVDTWAIQNVNENDIQEIAGGHSDFQEAAKGRNNTNGIVLYTWRRLPDNVQLQPHRMAVCHNEHRPFNISHGTLLFQGHSWGEERGYLQDP